MNEPDLVPVLFTFRDQWGGLWHTAGYASNELARGDDRKTLTGEHKDGRPLYLIDIKVVLEDEA